MNLVDANLLVYAVDETSPHHARAKPWLEHQLSGSETLGFAWAVLLAFVRLATNPRLFESPLTADEAFDLVDSWLAQPSATVVHPTDRHSRLLRELLAPLGTAGNLTTDAHLAALSVEHGAALCSGDSDFARFPRVRWINPLAPPPSGARRRPRP
ncbi:MAG: type II toxin-antitoxin system VapC family toxin [Actinobacteria bacterium]|nr:type II toxin-antitoxin system VapC family toxin [Actinomycetota bacterium]